MRRRDLIAAIGGTAATAWLRGAAAQSAAPGGIAAQTANLPLVGFLNSASAATYRFKADAFREGLAKAGFVEGHAWVLPFPPRFSPRSTK